MPQPRALQAVAYARLAIARSTHARWNGAVIGIAVVALSHAASQGQAVDFNQDGAVTNHDVVAYVHAYGIRFATYGVTDDRFNTGERLPRREADWQVYSISEPCLKTFGVSREAFPPEQVPSLPTIVRAFQQLPQQYIRGMGRDGYTLQIAELLGRFAKRWSVVANGFEGNLVIWRDPNGFAGALQFRPSPAGKFEPWERLRNITFDPTSGAVSFLRPRFGQRYSGTVDDRFDGTSRGAAMAGTYRQDGTDAVFTWSATAAYRTGATTEPHGFGSAHVFDECPRNHQEIGRTGPAIQFIVREDYNRYAAFHEVGHVVENLLRRHVGFRPEDVADFDATFGMNRDVTDGRIPELGSGFVNGYAASARGEDFAETFTWYFANPGRLEQRLAKESASDPMRRLARKAEYFRRVVDWPDPGAAAAIHPMRRDESPYVFTTTPEIRYGTRNRATGTIPDGGFTRTTPAVVAAGTRLWLFVVGLDMRVWYRSIDQSNNFSGWRNLSSWTRVPVAVTFHRDRNELFVLLRGDDRRVYFEALDVNGEPLRRGPVTNVTSALAPGAAVMNGRIHVFTVDTNGNGFTTDFALAGDGAFIDQTTPRAIDGASLRSGISASFDDTAQRGILLAALGGDFRVRTFVAAAGERSFAWRRESANLAAGVSVTSNGLLFTKGLADGRVYWKPFGSGTYAPWPGM